MKTVHFARPLLDRVIFPMKTPVFSFVAWALFALIVLVSPVQATPAQELIETLISNGTITADKAAAARKAVDSMYESPRIVSQVVSGEVTKEKTSFSTNLVIGEGRNGYISLLIRAIGPSLRYEGVKNFLPDPILKIYQNGFLVYVQDNWNTDVSVRSMRYIDMIAGAYSLEAGSLDAVADIGLPPGNYTFTVEGVKGATGSVLIEVYELNFRQLDGKGVSPTIIFDVSPTVVPQGQLVTISGFVLMGTAPLTRYRVFIVGSEGGKWQEARFGDEISFSSTVPTGINPKSFYHGAGAYTIRLEVEDALGYWYMQERTIILSTKQQ